MSRSGWRRGGVVTPSWPPRGGGHVHDDRGGACREWGHVVQSQVRARGSPHCLVYAMPGLFDRVRNGNDAAHQEVDAILRRMARALCRGGGPGGAAVDWEDVAQEASRHFFERAIHQYAGRGSEEGFLLRIVRTTVLQIVRAEARRQRREEATAPTDTTERVDATVALDVQRILSRLPEECGSLLERVYLLGESYGNLARELEMLESSVRTKVSRCLRRARELAAGEASS